MNRVLALAPTRSHSMLRSYILPSILSTSSPGHARMAIHIDDARFPEDREAIQYLFRGYAESLGIDLTFQNFQHELDSLPGKYAPSAKGALLVARSIENDAPDHSSIPCSPVQHPPAVGCVALRNSSDGWCEMKRLYVVNEGRGQRLGVQLLETILTRAKELGYRGIRLDTLPDMIAAQRLYRKYGFVEIPPYYETPIPGTLFMGCNFSGVP